MQISLSNDETQLLVRILSQYYSSLREEIHKTEAARAKTELKNEELTVRSLLDRLKA